MNVYEVSDSMALLKWWLEEYLPKKKSIAGAILRNQFGSRIIWNLIDLDIPVEGKREIVRVVCDACGRDAVSVAPIPSINVQPEFRELLDSYEG